MLIWNVSAVFHTCRKIKIIRIHVTLSKRKNWNEINNSLYKLVVIVTMINNRLLKLIVG